MEMLLTISQQKKLENILPNFAGSSPPISPKTSPTSLWKSLVLTFRSDLFFARFSSHVPYRSNQAMFRIKITRMHVFTYNGSFLTYSGGTVSKKDQTQFPDGGGNRNKKRPNRFSTVSKEDQTELPASIKKTKPNDRKQQRPAVSKK